MRFHCSFSFSHSLNFFEKKFALAASRTRLQAQAAGVSYSNVTEYICARMTAFQTNGVYSDLRCSPSCARAALFGPSFICPPDCFTYKGTLDVFSKIIQQEGIARLWRGTNAGLALAVPTVAIYLPMYDGIRNWMEDLTIRNAPSLTTYVPLVAGSMARSLACISCYPIELAKTRMHAFKEVQGGAKPPGVLKTLNGVLPSSGYANNMQNLQRYSALWTRVGRWSLQKNKIQMQNLFPTMRDYRQYLRKTWSKREMKHKRIDINDDMSFL
ncbi:hypothetical protein MKX03_018725, partial [Papaver bracteatum]